MVVNNWLARYQTEGVKGLTTRAGRGRPPILSQQNPQHLKKVAAEIKKHPNSVKTVVAVLEADLDLALPPSNHILFQNLLQTKIMCLCVYQLNIKNHFQKFQRIINHVF